jgi:hypothetical protein
MTQCLYRFRSEFGSKCGLTQKLLACSYPNWGLAVLWSQWVIPRCPGKYMRCKSHVAEPGTAMTTIQQTIKTNWRSGGSNRMLTLQACRAPPAAFWGQRAARAFNSIQAKGMWRAGLPKGAAGGGQAVRRKGSLSDPKIRLSRRPGSVRLKQG